MNASKILLWISLIFLIAFFLFSARIIINSVLTQEISTEQLTMQLLVENIYYSDLIMYEDAITGRVYPGRVDLKKFQDISFENEILTERRDIAMRIELAYGENTFEKYFLPGRDDEEYAIFASLASYNDQVAKLIPFPVIKQVHIYVNDTLVEGTLTFWVLMQQ